MKQNNKELTACICRHLHQSTISLGDEINLVLNFKRFNSLYFVIQSNCIVYQMYYSPKIFAQPLRNFIWILFQLNIMDQFTEDESSLFSDEGLLFGFEDSWDCDGCPPPVFNLPPPPRPPWLEDLDDCGSTEASLSEMLAQLETCDNTIIRDSHTLFEDKA